RQGRHGAEIEASIDTTSLEQIHELLAPDLMKRFDLHTNHPVHVAHVFAEAVQADAFVGDDSTSIPAHDFSALGLELFNSFHLSDAQCRLKVGHPVVEAAFVMVVAPGWAHGVVAQTLGSEVEVLVAGREDATLTGGNDLVSVEAEYSALTQTAHTPTFIFGAMGFGRILDQHNVVDLRNLAQGVHIGWMAVDMNRYDGLGGLRNKPFSGSGIDAKGFRIDIGKYRRCSTVSDRVGGSYKRKVGQYDFVSWTYVQGGQSKMKCRRAI